MVGITKLTVDKKLEEVTYILSKKRKKIYIYVQYSLKTMAN